jgi:beta-aspartyl-peptidase (threonine type)
LGTVGAVALDIRGNLAAATSTGGMTNKRFGRIGDTPLIGAGTYANNETCAVSCTGHGEVFIRNCSAFDLHAKMHYLGLSLEDAAEMLLNSLPKDAGGFIAIDNSGNIVMPFNSLGMFRGRADSSGMLQTAIW